MRYIFLIAIILIACSTSKKKIKVEHYKEFAAIKIGGKLSKDTLRTEQILSYYNSGNQKYFIGLRGYGKPDTSWYPDSKNKEEKHGDKTYYLDDKDSVVSIKVEKGDSIFFYDYSMTTPRIIAIVDKNKNLLAEIRPLYHTIERRNNIKFDQFKNPVYWESTEEYYPDDFDIENTTEIELQKKIIESRKYSIIEVTYTYY